MRETHDEVRCRIALSNDSYKDQVDLHRHLADFQEGDMVMVRVRPECFPKGFCKKLYSKIASPYKITKKISSNAYVLELPSNMGISLVFNFEDLSAYHGHSDCPIVPLPKLPLVPSTDVSEDIFGLKFISIASGGYQTFLVKWKNLPLLECSWIITEDLYCLNPELYEQYHAFNSLGSSYFKPGRDDGDWPRHYKIYSRKKKANKQDGKKKEQEFEMQDSIEELLQCQTTPTVHGNKEDSKFEGSPFHMDGKKKEQEFEMQDCIKELLQCQTTPTVHGNNEESKFEGPSFHVDGKKKEQEFEMQDSIKELLQCHTTPTVLGNKEESKFGGASFHVDGKKKEQEFEMQDSIKELILCQTTRTVHGNRDESKFEGASLHVDDKKKEQEFEMQDSIKELLQCQITPTVHGNKAESKSEGASVHVILERVRNIEAQLQQLQHLQALEPKIQKLEQLISTQLMEWKSEMLQGFALLSLQVQRSFGVPEASMDQDHTKEAINFQTQVVFPHASDFPSFTELEKKAIIYALFNPVGPLDENLVILWKFHLTRSELLCVRDGKCVSSAVMNCVVDVLVHEQFGNGLVKHHYFPTSFAEKILKDEPPSLEELKVFYEPSILKYDLLQCELLFIPLCVDSHWFIYVINLRDKRVEVLNSLPMSGFTVELNYLSRMKETCNEIMSSLSGRPMAITEWPVLIPELPIQKANYDCGIFMICYMEYWDGRLMKSFAQDDIPYLRMKIIADLLLHPENKVTLIR
ncbi:PREDICTED: uncharacterized protein LOC104611445 isoform X2 [Nelumbo nucifera]|uniref:Uncharacterized protein LOC104611445 isoform X2 n=1 Tax=Nelumbo nucifera TaxID=4432 RepID=A0A1U8QBY8_NELNU|nr:PREDICTED: uncharacterized protein LOC104611445 isoform X2 [Nelumbo nucifera]